MQPNTNKPNDVGADIPSQAGTTPAPATKPKNNKFKGKPRGPGKGASAPTSRVQKTESTEPKPAPKGNVIFPEGVKALESFGLSLSGRLERVLSPVKTEHYFQLVELAWARLVEAKPAITQRFSLSEWRHAHALMLYGRMEQVKFDALGVKPSAPVRIPLPKNLRVYQPLWSILASIGVVRDEDLGVEYIPDAVLPKSEDLSDENDIENLLSCALYDWTSSWSDVSVKRKDRPLYNGRDGIEVDVNEHQDKQPDHAAIIKKISELRKQKVESDKMYAKFAQNDTKSLRMVNDVLYVAPANVNQPADVDDKVVVKTWITVRHPDTVAADLQTWFDKGKAKKAEMIRPRFDEHLKLSVYSITDDVVVTDPGAYGKWLHWDSRLWTEYSQLVEDVAQVAMFSLSMPNETEGTYTWLLPVESKTGDIFCKLPKRGITTPTWILALLVQMSMLPKHRRSTWYVESDHISNWTRLAVDYIRSGVKHAAPVEQYGTY